MDLWFVAADDNLVVPEQQSTHLNFQTTQAARAWVCAARREVVFLNFFGDGLGDFTCDTPRTAAAAPRAEADDFELVVLCAPGTLPLESHAVFTAYAARVERLADFTSIYAGMPAPHPLATLYNFVVDAPKRRRIN
jgi:hypothetical protein